MVKRGKTKSAKKSVKARKGARYVCNACGMTVAVDKECCCDPCDLTCCGQNMTLLTCS